MPTTRRKFPVSFHLSEYSEDQAEGDERGFEDACRLYVLAE